jgi:hypothetical protein
VKKLSRATLMRDARRENNLPVTELDELMAALQRKNPFFSVIPSAVKEQLKGQRVTKELMKAPTPGMYICFPSTDDTEAKQYVDTNA